MIWWVTVVTPSTGDMGIGMRSAPSFRENEGSPLRLVTQPANDPIGATGPILHTPLSLVALAREIADRLPGEPVVSAVLEWQPIESQCRFRLSQYELGDLGAFLLEADSAGPGTTVRVIGAPCPCGGQQATWRSLTSSYERRSRYLTWITEDLFESLSANPLSQSSPTVAIAGTRRHAPGRLTRTITEVMRSPFEEATSYISGRLSSLLIDDLDDLDTSLGRLRLSMAMTCGRSRTASTRFEVAGSLTERADGWGPGRRLRTGKLLCLELRSLGSSLTWIQGSFQQPRLHQENPQIDPAATTYLVDHGYIATVDLAFEELFTELANSGESRGIMLLPQGSSPRGPRSPYPENEWAKEQVHLQGRRPATVYREWLTWRSKLAAEGLRHELADPWDSFKKLIRPPRHPSHG